MSAPDTRVGLDAVRDRCARILSARTLPERDEIAQAVREMERDFDALVAEITVATLAQLQGRYTDTVRAGRLLIEEIRAEAEDYPREDELGWSIGARDRERLRNTYVHARALAAQVTILAEIQRTQRRLGR
ncbi:hypothetical protein [Streptomyces sp. NPDC051561]|uniref:hypothetical protein n=1 Tax=Streptomyces sp. NPDC051561 TaxID=3365658 RepID=UPI0037B9617A